MSPLIVLDRFANESVFYIWGHPGNLAGIILRDVFVPICPPISDNALGSGVQSTAIPFLS